MIDNKYKDAFKEVFDILENTDEDLKNRISTKFMKFIENNMNKQYETNIRTDVPIDKQPLLKETEAVLALIYRSYWATDEEKIEFSKKDKQELIVEEEKKKQQYRSINEIFDKRKNINKITLDTDLIVIPKENFIQKIFKEIIRFFK